MRAYLTLASFALLSFAIPLRGDLPADVATFLQRHCADCHADGTTEGGLDLAALTHDLDDVAAFDRWVHAFDRVTAGEMPPKEASSAGSEETAAFLADLGGWLRTSAETRSAREGRVQARRLTAIQFERSLHDALGIDVPLAGMLPEEPRSGGFDTIAEGQSFSHFDLENRLIVVDAALDEAFRRAAAREGDENSRQMSPVDLARKDPDDRCRDPELFEGMAVTWSAGLQFYGRISATTAREPGWYRLSFDVSALKSPPQGVWCTVRTGHCKSSAPSMTEIATFLATDEPGTVTVEAWLEPGQMFEVRPYDARIKRGQTPGGQVGAGEMQPQDVPGIGLHGATLARVHRGPDDGEIRDRLFGGLPFSTERRSRSERAIRLRSDDPRADLARLMRRFANRAFRRPEEPEALEGYVELAVSTLNEKDPASLADALRAGYRAILCSPRFLYFHEEPGELDQYALATRLSYFLWNAPPDGELIELAEAGRLDDAEVLRGQVERMLDDEREERFVADFARQWLDLSEIDFTAPDRKLYPGFDLIVQQSMLAETRAYLRAMLDQDLGVSHVVDSDFCFLNERLADHYGIDGVQGGELRRVPLDDDSPRGGLLTQGAILKVTANGTTTSPVIRGVWVSERLLGEHIPPPPKNVPAVEPDIRGGATIREQLDLHKSEASCAGCHVKIDPPGFALENFDPAGAWRDRYVHREGEKRVRGPEVDAAYAMPDGERFDDVVGFQRIVAVDEKRLARNVASQLIAYGTGAPVAFGARDDVERIVESAASSDYGLRSLVHAVVQSPTFRRK